MVVSSDGQIMSKYADGKIMYSAGKIIATGRQGFVLPVRHIKEVHELHGGFVLLALRPLLKVGDDQSEQVEYYRHIVLSSEDEQPVPTWSLTWFLELITKYDKLRITRASMKGCGLSSALTALSKKVGARREVRCDVHFGKEMIVLLYHDDEKTVDVIKCNNKLEVVGEAPGYESSSTFALTLAHGNERLYLSQLEGLRFEAVLSVLKGSDITYVGPEALAQFNIEAVLDGFVAHAPVKDVLRHWHSGVARRRRRLQAGVPVRPENNRRHMVLTGNPGTGKTEAARMIAAVLYRLGVVKTDKVVEVQRPDLVAEHIGRTAPKTRAVLKQAAGGILFIDEAYQLANRGHIESYGKEAIETIMEAMLKDDVVIIVAGYPAEMALFMAQNIGLRRRFDGQGSHILLPDYTPAELAQIVEKKLFKNDFTLNMPLRVVEDAIVESTDEEYRAEMNGGLAELLARYATDAQEVRIDALPDEQFREQAARIEEADIRAAALQLQGNTAQAKAQRLLVETDP